MSGGPLPPDPPGAAGAAAEGDRYEDAAHAGEGSHVVTPLLAKTSAKNTATLVPSRRARPNALVPCGRIPRWTDDVVGLARVQVVVACQ